MQRVDHSEILPFKQAELFDLVCDIESYPEFLPWCGSVTVHSRDATAVEATVEVKKGFLSKSFTTRNELDRPKSIDMQLLEGPFKHMHGLWTFTKLSAARKPETNVSLAMEFEFDSILLAGVLGPIFNHISDTMLHRFCEHAHHVLGKGAKKSS